MVSCPPTMVSELFIDIRHQINVRGGLSSLCRYRQRIRTYLQELIAGCKCPQSSLPLCFNRDASRNFAMVRQPVAIPLRAQAQAPQAQAITLRAQAPLRPTSVMGLVLTSSHQFQREVTACTAHCAACVETTGSRENTFFIVISCVSRGIPTNADWRPAPAVSTSGSLTGCQFIRSNGNCPIFPMVSLPML